MTAISWNYLRSNSRLAYYRIKALGLLGTWLNTHKHKKEDY